MVTVIGERSGKRRVLSRVPQGSVLGPLLFVLYINDLPEVVRLIPFLFVDDTELLKRIKSGQDSLELQRQRDVEVPRRMYNCTMRWILRFHPGKCHVLTLGKFDKIKHAHSYKLDNKVLDHVLSKKDLGVIFDSGLSFEEHIFNQVKKSNFNGWFYQKKLLHLTPDLFCQL